uniref:Cyclin N-terminal domain-containing protein n=1 Tax=Romanomermis culicivorax TaxID=13658 RepID=A0A915HPN4_ROMCU
MTARNTSIDPQPSCSWTREGILKNRLKPNKKRPKLSICSKRKKFIALKKRKNQENLLRQTSLRMFAVRASAGKKSSCCKKKNVGSNATTKLSTVKKLVAADCATVTKNKSTLRRVLMASCGSQCFSSRDVSIIDDQYHKASCSYEGNAPNLPTFCNITAACCQSSSSSSTAQQQCCRSRNCQNRSSILAESSYSNFCTTFNKFISNHSIDEPDNDLISGQKFNSGSDMNSGYQPSVAQRLDSSWRAVGRERERLDVYCKSAGITLANRSHSASLILPISRTKFSILQQSVASTSSVERCSCCSKSSFNTAFEFQAQSLVRLSAPVNINAKKFRNGQTPLPHFEWADGNTVWNLMCWKDTAYHRNAYYLLQHPGINARMRSILLDWLNEVCQEYRLHRETFYLSIDFIDRYLSKEKNVSKENLQLVGVTALFIAAKLEEIYPPKCSQFAEMTAGACTVEQIENQELIMLHSLQWSLCPITPIHWAAIYLQIIENNESVNKSNAKIKLQNCQLIDLCMLDTGNLKFPYSVVAACAFAHVVEPDDLILNASGYKPDDLWACYQWMEPFALCVHKLGELQCRTFSEVPYDDAHNIQVRSIDLELLERSQALQLEILRTNRLTPVFSINDKNANSDITNNVNIGNSIFNIYPTPPNSDERPNAFFSNNNSHHSVAACNFYQP